MAIESKTMREIHDIRAKLHEETKNMTPKEHTEFVHHEADKVAREFGLTQSRKAAPPTVQYKATADR